MTPPPAAPRLDSEPLSVIVVPAPLGEGTRQRALGLGLFEAEPVQSLEDLFPHIDVSGRGDGERRPIGAAIGVADLERGRRA